MNDSGPHMHSGLAAVPRYWLRYGASHYDSITFALVPDATSLSTTPRSLCLGPLPMGRGAQAGGAVYILSLRRYQNSLEWSLFVLHTSEYSPNFDSTLQYHLVEGTENMSPPEPHAIPFRPLGETPLFKEEKEGWKGYIEWEKYPEKKKQVEEVMRKYDFPDVRDALFFTLFNPISQYGCCAPG